MTDKEIIQAWECHISRSLDDCKQCPYKDLKPKGCQEKLYEDIADLINRQHTIIEQLYKAIDEKSKHIENIKAEKNKLMEANILQSKQGDELQAEIDRLKKYNTDVAHKHYDDGIKEFALRLREKMWPFPKPVTENIKDTVAVLRIIDDTEKEMAGADNDT